MKTILPKTKTFNGWKQNLIKHNTFRGEGFNLKKRCFDREISKAIRKRMPLVNIWNFLKTN